MSRKKKFYIGVDIGGTKIAAALITENADIICRNKLATPQNCPAEDVFKALQQVVDELLKKANCSKKLIIGMGIGVPGVIDNDCASILVTPNIDLAGFPLRQLSEDYFKWPVCLGNDVNLGLLGEVWLGKAVGKSNVVALFLGTGVGGAVMVSDFLLTGAHGAAAELGHMYIDKSSDHQSAGLQGTLEALAGRRSIERRIRKAIESGQSTVVMNLTQGNLSQIKSRVLKEALKANDEVVMHVLDEVCQSVGDACVSLQHIFNPELIILGGGVVEACGDFIVPKVQAVVDDDPFMKEVKPSQVVAASLGDDSVLYGAVSHFKMTLKADTKKSGSNETSVDTIRDGVLIGDRYIHGRFYMTAEDKLKKIKPKSVDDYMSDQFHLDIALVKKLFKDKLNDIILGCDDEAMVFIDQDALDYMKKKSINVQKHSVKKAIDVYQAHPAKTALVIIV